LADIIPAQRLWHQQVSGTNKTIRATTPCGPHLRTGANQRVYGSCSSADGQERESSESPMLNAFWRVAPSVLLSFLAICDALVFLRAIVFSSRTSAEVHARRFFFLFAIKPPFQESQLVSLTGANEKPTDEMKITFGSRTIATLSTTELCDNGFQRRYGTAS